MMKLRVIQHPTQALSGSLKKCAVMLLLSFSAQTFAETAPSAGTPAAAIVESDYIIPDVPNIDAEAYILIDANSGKVLAAMNEDVRRDPASLTKMMTSYVVGEYLLSGKITYNDIVTVGKSAWAAGNPILAGSSIMFLKPGDQVSIAELNKGIIIQSGNDACIAMAEHVAGSEDAFVSLMNTYAERMGLKNTRFETVHGLDAPDQYTTARDMSTLARSIIFEHPQDYLTYGQKEFSYNKIKQLNRNGLLWDTSLKVDGMKTGHTNAAGYNLVASAVDGNTRLISVVLGGRTFKGRESESKKLLTWGFRFHETVAPYKANTPVVKKRVWFGDTDSVALGYQDDITLTIPRGQSQNLKMNYVLNDKELQSPLKKGQVVGKIRFTIGSNLIEEKPLVALEPVKDAGFFGTVFEYVKYKFHQWFG